MVQCTSSGVQRPSGEPLKHSASADVIAMSRHPTMCGMLRTSLRGLQPMAVLQVVRVRSMLRDGLLASRCAVLQGLLPAAPGRLGSRHRTPRALQEAPLQARRPAPSATSPVTHACITHLSVLEIRLSPISLASAALDVSSHAVHVHHCAWQKWCVHAIRFPELLCNDAPAHWLPRRQCCKL